MVEVQPEPRAKVAESVARVALVDLQCIPVLQLPEAAGVPELLHAGIQHLLGVGQLAFKIKLERVVVVIVLSARNELLESGYASRLRTARPAKCGASPASSTASSKFRPSLRNWRPPRPAILDPPPQLAQNRTS